MFLDPVSRFSVILSHRTMEPLSAKRFSLRLSISLISPPYHVTVRQLTEYIRMESIFL